MDYVTRQAVYRQIEKDRKSKVLTFVTSDRQNMETQISSDCIEMLVNLLDQIGPNQRISLILHTNGGDALAAWRIVNLLRGFSDDFEVMIASKALSAGTLISIGAKRIVMTKQAALGPIDPSVNHPLNPQVNMGGQARVVAVSVEAVRGYLDVARDELGIKGETGLTEILRDLAGRVHPLVIGQIFRSRAQIRFLADKLLHGQVADQDKKQSIVNFLCSDSGSHDYSINRREAAELGLSVEKPSDRLYRFLRKVHVSYADQLKVLQPYSQQVVLGATPLGTPVAYTEYRGLIESVNGGSWAFVTEGALTKVQVNTPMGVQEGVRDDRAFEGWKKVA